MNILGISAFYHDSAAALLVDGEPIAAAQEERFTRVKHDHSFPLNAARYCLREAGIEAADLDIFFLGSCDENDCLAYGNTTFTSDAMLAGTYYIVVDGYSGDCGDYMLEVDEIYNLACPASPIHYQRDPVQTTKTSVHGAINMLGLAKRTRAKILQASTSEVYGDPAVHPAFRGLLEAVPGQQRPGGYFCASGTIDWNLPIDHPKEGDDPLGSRMRTHTQRSGKPRNRPACRLHIQSHGPTQKGIRLQPALEGLGMPQQGQAPGRGHQPHVPYSPAELTIGLDGGDNAGFVGSQN